MERKVINPGAFCTFVFAVILWICSFDYLGVFTGDNYLVYSAIDLVGFISWLIGAKYYYEADNAIMGHFYMVFGIMFGGFLGSTYLVFYISHIFPSLVMDTRILGVIYLVGGIFVIPTLPAFLYVDKVNLITWTACTLWLLVGGISYFAYSYLVYILSLVFCLISTVGVTYMMLSEATEMCYGKGLPMGKPFIGATQE